MKVIGIHEGCDFKYTQFIYLHGKLAELNGVDYCYIPKKPKERGLYPCTIIINENSYPGFLVYWKSKLQGNMDRGLVCMYGDIKAEEDAMRKFHKEVEYL